MLDVLARRQDEARGSDARLTVFPRLKWGNLARRRTLVISRTRCRISEPRSHTDFTDQHAFLPVCGGDGCVYLEIHDV